MYSKLLTVVVGLGSLFFLISGLRTREKGENSRATLEILGGLAGLLYVGLDLYWHFVVTLWQTRWLVIAYYVTWHFAGGVATAMLLYAGRLLSARVLLTASVAFLVVTNLFLIPRLRYGIRPLCLADGLFGGLLIASLILIRFEHRQRQSATLEA